MEKGNPKKISFGVDFGELFGGETVCKFIRMNPSNIKKKVKICVKSPIANLMKKKVKKISIRPNHWHMIFYLTEIIFYEKISVYGVKKICTRLKSVIK